MITTPRCASCPEKAERLVPLPLTLAYTDASRPVLSGAEIPTSFSDHVCIPATAGVLISTLYQLTFFFPKQDLKLACTSVPLSQSGPVSPGPNPTLLSSLSVSFQADKGSAPPVLGNSLRLPLIPKGSGPDPQQEGSSH